MEISITNTTSLNLARLRNTLVGASMMALALSSLAACGSKSSGSAADSTNGTDSTSNSGGSTGSVVGTPLASVSTVSGTTNGQTVKMPFVTYSVSSTDTGTKKYALEFTDYDPCIWAASHDSSLLPKNFDLLGVYLLDQAGGAIAAPAAGTYTVGATTGNGIDAKTSGFGIVTNCVGIWPGFTSGGTVTIDSIDATSKVATGSVNLTLTGGGTITGTFTTASCTGSITTTPPANDPAACTSVK